VLTVKSTKRRGVKKRKKKGGKRGGLSLMHFRTETDGGATKRTNTILSLEDFQ